MLACSDASFAGEEVIRRACRSATPASPYALQASAEEPMRARAADADMQNNLNICKWESSSAELADSVGGCQTESRGCFAGPDVQQVLLRQLLWQTPGVRHDDDLIPECRAPILCIDTPCMTCEPPTQRMHAKSLGGMLDRPRINLKPRALRR